MRNQEFYEMLWTGSTWTGTYSYQSASGKWHCSSEVFDIYGWEEDTEPNLELLANGLHDGDRADFRSIVIQCREAGGIFGEHYRLLDNNGISRVVTIAGEGHANDQGDFDVCGFIIDITRVHVREVSADASENVNRALETRGNIDQAKGVLMFVYGMDESAAFATLKWCSQRSNEKLSKIADRIATAASMGLNIGADVRTKLDATLAELSINAIGLALDISKSTIDTRFDANSFPGRAVVLAVAGNVDLATIPRFSDAVNDLILASDPPVRAVVDLTQVAYLGTVALPVLLNASRRCRRAGSVLRVVLSEDTSASGLSLDREIQVFPDVEKAAEWDA